jgi:hypothetical protein
MNFEKRNFQKAQLRAVQDLLNFGSYNEKFGRVRGLKYPKKPGWFFHQSTAPLCWHSHMVAI